MKETCIRCGVRQIVSLVGSVVGPVDKVVITDLHYDVVGVSIINRRNNSRSLFRRENTAKTHRKLGINSGLWGQRMKGLVGDILGVQKGYGNLESGHSLR